MKKIVLRAEINCEKCRREAYEAISRVEGVESATIDIKEKKVTVIGDADPAYLTMELRRLGWAEILSVGPNVQDTPKPIIKADKDTKPPPQNKTEKQEVKNGSKKEDNKNDSKKDSTNKVQPQEINVYVRGFPEEKVNYNQTLVIRGGCNHYDDVYFLSDENPNACSIC